MTETENDIDEAEEIPADPFADVEPTNCPFCAGKGEILTGEVFEDAPEIPKTAKCNECDGRGVNQ